MEASHQEPGPRRRRTFVVDKKWQTSVTLRLLCSAMVAVSLVQFVGIQILSSGDLADIGGSDAGLVALVLSGVQMVVLLVALWHTTIRITHSVAGPAFVIERAVEAMREGKFDSRLTLRKGDYLGTLAAAVKRLAEQMQAQQDTGASPATPAQARAPEAETPLLPLAQSTHVTSKTSR